MYASFTRRFSAYTLDNILIVFITATAAVSILGERDAALFQSPDDLSTAFWLVYGFYTFASIGYFTILISGGGQTVGKWLLGIKVTLPDGEQVSTGRALVRCIGYYISGVFLYIGFLVSLIDPRRQAFHDKIAGTVVVEI